LYRELFIPNEIVNDKRKHTIMINIKQKTHELIKEYNGYIITIWVIFMFEILNIINTYIEMKDFEQTIDILKYLLEIIFFLLAYIFIDISLKKIRMKKTIKVFINIILAAAICSFLEINILFFIERNPEVIIENSHKAWGVLFQTFISEFIEIVIYLTTAFIVQYIIKRFLLSSFSLDGAGFISKIPEHERKDIYLIKSQENYIDVFYGKNGKHKLINYTFSNTLKEIDPDLGLQVHRSYWVSKSTIKTLKRQDKKYFITASNDEKIPVSQTYIKSVKQIKENL